MPYPDVCLVGGNAEALWALPGMTLNLFQSDPSQPDLFGVDISGVPPEVLTKFEELAVQVARRGFSRYSADAILHRIRWHYHIERDDRDFKCNNNWTSVLSRWFMEQHPEHAGFFETRAAPGTRPDE